MTTRPDDSLESSIFHLCICMFICACGMLGPAVCFYSIRFGLLETDTAIGWAGLVIFIFVVALLALAATCLYVFKRRRFPMGTVCLLLIVGSLVVVAVSLHGAREFILEYATG